LLLPSSASAQFGFPGISFRVPYVGGGGGHYRGRHHRTHESSRHRSKSEEEEREPEEHTAQGNGKSAPQPLAAPIKDAQPAQPVAAAPAKPAGEEPTFSPSR
jgi:hypothetical protein